MLRIVIALALVFAVVWYLQKDRAQGALVEQVQSVDVARDAVEAAGTAAAQAAAQADAVRDQTLGGMPGAATDDGD